MDTIRTEEKQTTTQQRKAIENKRLYKLWQNYRNQKQNKPSNSSNNYTTKKLQETNGSTHSDKGVKKRNTLQTNRTEYSNNNTTKRYRKEKALWIMIKL